jgi:nitroreductase
MDAIECLKTRRSVRNFSDKEIPEDAINEIIDAGRLAPTANNLQPWEFVVVTDKPVKKKIADITDGGKFIAEAPLCFFVISKDIKHYLEDGSAATQNIMLSAWARGIGTCWVAGDKKPYAGKILEILGVPAGYKLVSMIAAGYPKSMPGAVNKRGLGEVMHKEKF